MIKFLQAMNLVTQVAGKNAANKSSRGPSMDNEGRRKMGLDESPKRGSSSAKIGIDLTTRAKLMPAFMYKLMRIKMKIAYHA